MADIRPFAAYRYDASRVCLEDVLTQPYDKITPAMQESYSRRSPHNLVAVEKGKELPDDTTQHNVYSRAAAALESWIRDGVLLRDPAPAIYGYSQDYQLPGAAARTVRTGFIALGRVVDYSQGVVFRHEQTFAGPKADRLELLRKTRVHTGQLFMLYQDPAKTIDTLLEQALKDSPAIEVRDDYQFIHRAWPISDPAVIERVRAAMADKKLVIADGHHRYETALAFRDECRKQTAAAGPDAPHEWVMMTLVNTHAPGVTILPTHRVVANLPRFDFAELRRKLEPLFECASFEFSSGGDRQARYAEFRDGLAAQQGQGAAVGVFAGTGAFHLFRLRPGADLAAVLPDLSPAQRRLDVVLLHRILIEQGLGISGDAKTREKHLSYEREMDAAIAAVDSGRAQLCCLLNPLPVEQVCAMALAGEVLPQKSTDFYPKLLSGIAIYRLDG